MKSTRLKAFTVAEMLVVLVVSSIIIAMAFLVLNMVRKQVISIQKNYQKKQIVQFFNTQITRDFNMYNAFYDDQRNVLIMKNTKDSIQYQFLKESLIREKDTFFIEIANKKLFLDGKEVNDANIDAVEINLSNEFANKQLFIQQTKDASYYVN